MTNRDPSVHPHGPHSRPRALPPPRLGYEEKVAGYRMLAYKDGAGVRLVSRNGVDHTRPGSGDLAATITKLSARTLVLDGEVAIYDQRLRSRFDWLRDPDRDAAASPPLLIAFDLLHCDRRAIPS